MKAFHDCPQCGSKHATPMAAAKFRTRNMTCVHCDKPCYDDYSLEDDVWSLTGLGEDDGRLHLVCVEDLIGRDLTMSDFSAAPINSQLRWAVLRGMSLGLF
jgi:hypothetical protein